MPSQAPPSDFRHWSDYWSTGALTSLPQDFAFNYDGEVATFWQEQFASLADGVHLLDICTGNGPIALLAAAWAKEHQLDLKITAVDAAKLSPDLIAGRNPEASALLERVRFRGNTPVESLPFDADEFALVTSQYGLEYCCLGQAAGELVRVLQPDGQLVMLCHGASSDMMSTMATEQRDYALLEDSRLFSVLRSWEVGQLSEPDFKRRLDGLLRKLSTRNRKGRSALVNHVIQSMSGLLGLPVARLREQRHAVSAFRQQLMAGKARLADMLRVNRMIDENPDWHQPLADAGLQLVETSQMIYRGQHQMGQCYRWKKPKA